MLELENNKKIVFRNLYKKLKTSLHPSTTLSFSSFLLLPISATTPAPMPYLLNHSPHSHPLKHCLLRRLACKSSFMSIEIKEGSADTLIRVLEKATRCSLLILTTSLQKITPTSYLLTPTKTC